jgi:hypothetical protein
MHHTMVHEGVKTSPVFAIGFADLPSDVIAEGYHQMNMALKEMIEKTN